MQVCFGQSNGIIKESITSTISCSPDSLSYIYRGIPNEVSISVSGITFENIIVHCSKCDEIIRYKDKFGVWPITFGNITLDIYKKVNETDSIYIGAIRYKVKEIPGPYAMVGGQKKGNIDKTKLLVQWGVITIIDKVCAKFPVLSFDFEYDINGEYRTITNPSSGQFTSEMVEAIKQLPPSSRVYFSNIKVKGPDQTIRYITGISLKVM